MMDYRDRIAIEPGKRGGKPGCSWRSTLWTWNTFFAKSTPTRLSFMVDSFSLVTGVNTSSLAL